MRMSQRGISTADVEYVLVHGTRIRSGGVLHVYLRRKDIPAPEQARWSQREGLQVRMDKEGVVVITVFQNRSKNALGDIRRKAKWDRRPEYVSQSDLVY